jgi:nitroreductase
MNETLRTIQDLHSTHGGFSETPLGKEDLETILQASVRAANAGNAQNYAIIVTEDQALMKEVCGCQAPVMLVYCVDVQRNMDLASHLGLAYTVDPAWMLMTGVTDAALAAQTAVMAARSLGIDSLVSNGVQRGDVKRFWRLLDLPPQNVIPVLAVYLGYAGQKEFHRAGRLFEPGVIHRGKYQHRNAEALEAVIAATDAPGFSAPRLSNWREQGCAHYLESFFKGSGGRAAKMYGGIAPALAAAGIGVSAAKEVQDA